MAPFQLLTNQQYQNFQTIVLPIQMPQENNQYILVQQLPEQPQPQMQNRPITVKPEVIDLDSDSEDEPTEEEQFEVIEIAPMAISEVKSLAPSENRKRKPGPLTESEKIFKEFATKRKFYDDTRNRPVLTLDKIKKVPAPPEKPCDVGGPLFRVNKKQQMFDIGRVTACYGKESDFRTMEIEDVGQSGEVEESLEEPQPGTSQEEPTRIREDEIIYEVLESAKSSETESEEETTEYVIKHLDEDPQENQVKFIITQYEHNKDIDVPQPTSLIQIEQNPRGREKGKLPQKGKRKAAKSYVPPEPVEVSEASKEAIKLESQGVPPPQADGNVDFEQFMDTYLI
jgi:hypothetical protein